MPGPPPAPSRRSALIGGCAGLVGLVGAGLGAAACSRGGGGPAPSEPPSPAPVPDPDAGVRESARQAEETLIALHVATVARHPGLRPALAPATGHHQVHLDTLAGTSPRPAVTRTGSATMTPPPVPDDQAAALSAVRAAEAAAAAERLLDCLASTDPGLAAVLASVGAAEAAHAALLAGGA